MKTTTRLSGALLGVALTLYTSGCVGTGPNTQQGAVAGGALGALAGAVIGNNSGGHNGLAGALIGGTVGAIAGGTIGNAKDVQQGTVYGAGPRPVYYEAEPPPPPPPPAQAETVIPAAPTPDSYWVGGYWAFDGSGYTWIHGHWEIPPPETHVYVASHWERRGHTSIFIRGYWR